MRTKQLGLLALVLVLVAGVIGAKALRAPGAGAPAAGNVAPVAPRPVATPTHEDLQPAPSGGQSPLGLQASTRPLPRLLELGSTTCGACKRMEVILQELRAELRGKVDVEFIDIYKVEGAAEKHGVDLIPTQILFDARGKELFRHTGVYPKAELLAKMKALGMLKE